MRIHHAALIAVCCAPLLLAGVAVGCGSPNDSCSGPYAALYCGGGDGGLEASEGAPPVDGSLDVHADGPAHDGPAPSEGGEEGEAGCPAPTTLDCNGTCVDPTQPTHCSTCDNVCPGPDAGSGQATCTNGTCGLGCTAPTSLNCSGACLDPSQPTHCGSCSNVCPGATAGTGTPVCTLGSDGGGECSVTCTGTTTEACPGGACYAPLDPNHCGSCTNACPAPPSGNGQATCASPSTCGVSCTTGIAHVCANDCLLNTDEPSDTADPCILTETFGVFVAPTGSDAAGTAGSRIAPYATVGHAMDQAKAAGLARVYACGSAGNYTENLVVGASRTGITVYGGLDCTTSPSTWSYVATDKATVAPASGYALQVTAAVTFEDFAFTSAAATTPGSSSIAVFASNATGVVLRRCDVQAGAGAAGQDQSPTAPFSTAAPPGSPGSTTNGGGLTTYSCTDGTGTSLGGAGGPPAIGGTAGNPGGPGGTANGGDTSDCLNHLTGGGSGSAGAPGSAGSGALSWATFIASGWTSGGGAAGGNGAVAQGGGGGASVGATGGGGGGGAGGCGGVSGQPGTGGGSSIALLVFGSSVDLEQLTVVASAAGRGGNGAGGQTGQGGGGGGSPGGNACSGGAGGSGGDGGGGGGGAGGLSAGVVWTGTAPTVNGASTPSATTLTGFTTGAAGVAGTGGLGNAKAGVAGAVVQFQ